MTPQDIEKLKALCEKEGFELDFISKSTQGAMDIFRVSKKDEWEGVEFAIADYNGIIYKIDRFETSPMKKIWFSHGKFLFPEKCKPSTEAAYVEQLKAKAKELYGEIKDGDRFDVRELGYSNRGDLSICLFREATWRYDKNKDELSLACFSLYKQGKWAKKVEEPIKANITSFTLSNPYSTIVFTTSHRIKERQVDVKEFVNHIEESIEAFLNRKP